MSDDGLSDKERAMLEPENRVGASFWLSPVIALSRVTLLETSETNLLL